MFRASRIIAISAMSVIESIASQSSVASSTTYVLKVRKTLRDLIEMRHLFYPIIAIGALISTSVWIPGDTVLFQPMLLGLYFILTDEIFRLGGECEVRREQMPSKVDSETSHLSYICGYPFTYTLSKYSNL